MQEWGLEGAAPTPEAVLGVPRGSTHPGSPTHPAPGTRGCRAPPCPAVKWAEAAAGGTQREGLVAVRESASRGNSQGPGGAGRQSPPVPGGRGVAGQGSQHAQVSPLPPGQGK